MIDDTFVRGPARTRPSARLVVSSGIRSHGGSTDHELLTCAVDLGVAGVDPPESLPEPFTKCVTPGKSPGNVFLECFFVLGARELQSSHHRM
jgi:hypothetical protein